MVDILTEVETKGAVIKVQTTSKESWGVDTQFTFKGGTKKEEVIEALIEILTWVRRNYSVTITQAVKA